MTVEKVGEDESCFRFVSCRRCCSRLKYKPLDVTRVTHKDYDGGTDTSCHIKCPVCHCNVTVKE